MASAFIHNSFEDDRADTEEENPLTILQPLYILTRMNFKIIDPLVGFCSGAIIAFAVSQVIPEGWNMILAMAVGGSVGMLLKFIFLLLLAPFFGAFEVMIPLSIIAMSVGMLSGMAAAQGSATAECISATGGIIGLAISTAIYFSNNRLTKQ
jgi:predicted ATP-dependent Lon-type protease